MSKFDKIKSILNDKARNSVSYYSITEAPVIATSAPSSGDGDKEEKIIIGSPDDTVLDPEFNKEFFLKSFDIGENSVVIKTIGIGKNKPVSVYINDIRWELFPGPKNAEKETKNFVSSKQFDKWLEKKSPPPTQSSLQPEVSEEGGAGEEGTDELTKKYKKDTPGESPKKKTTAKKKSTVKESSVLGSLNWSCNQDESVVISFDNGNESLEVCPNTSEMLLRIRESLNTQNRYTYDHMLSESKKNFLKLVAFGTKNKTGDTNV